MAARVSEVSFFIEPCALLSSSDAIKAQVILHESQTIQTSEKIIPKCELGTCTIEMVESGSGFATLGQARFLKMLKFQERIKRVREAVNRAIKLVTGKPLFLCYAQRALTAVRFGIGECMEISMHLRIKAWLAGIRGLYDVSCENPDDSSINHTFTIFGKEIAKEVKAAGKRSALDALERLPSAVVLDGFLLDRLIAAKNVKQVSKFADYFKAQGITVINIEAFNPKESDVASLLKEVDEVFEKAKEILSTLPSQSPEISKQIKANEPRICASHLERLIPDTKWKRNAEKQIVWLETIEDKANEIAGYLNANGVGALVKGEKSGPFVVIIANPDYEKMEKLPAFNAKLFKEKRIARPFQKSERKAFAKGKS
jgi:hypothetical protein